MKGYDSVHWFAYVILVGVFGVVTFGAYLAFGVIGLWCAIIVGIINAIYLIVFDVQTRQIEHKTKPKDESYFTDEDFINCKVGEWVSRP